MSGLPKANALQEQGESGNKNTNRRAHPTAPQFDMQVCKRLFAELAADNFQTAKLLSDEISNIDDESEKRHIGSRILNALRMATVFGKSSKRVCQ
jgi:hypothetical protein